MSSETVWKQYGIWAGTIITAASVLIATGEQNWATTINIRWVVVFVAWCLSVNILAAITAISLINGKSAFITGQAYGFLIIIGIATVMLLIYLANDFFLNTWPRMNHTSSIQ